MSNKPEKLMTAFNVINPAVCELAGDDLIFHYELGEVESTYVDGSIEEEESFALQRQGSKVVYKKLVKDCKRLEDNPHWVEVVFENVPKCGKYQLYYQPGVKKEGDLGVDTVVEKVERLPLFNDFIEFSQLEQGYQDEYEEIEISEFYQDDSSEDEAKTNGSSTE